MVDINLVQLYIVGLRCSIIHQFAFFIRLFFCLCIRPLDGPHMSIDMLRAYRFISESSGHQANIYGQPIDQHRLLIDFIDC